MIDRDPLRAVCAVARDLYVVSHWSETVVSSSLLDRVFNLGCTHIDNSTAAQAAKVVVVLLKAVAHLNPVLEARVYLFNDLKVYK